MADFRISKKSSGQQQKQAKADVTPEQSASLLSKAGGAAASGLHSIASILSYPSRLLWGGVSGISGHGYGNQSILDSTGGKELSHVLGEQGVIAPNDESAWEFLPGIDKQGRFNPGDVGRGVIDMLGDPTSWLGAGALTKAGVAASKAGTLTKGLTNSIRAGERGLIGLRTPLSTSGLGAIGTGGNVADALETAGRRTGVTRAAQAVSGSAPVRNMRALFDARVSGKIHPIIQGQANERHALKTAAQRQIDLDMAALATKRQNMGLTTPEASEALRDVLEGLPHPTKFDPVTGMAIQPSHNPVHIHQLAQEMKDLSNRAHAADTHVGFMTGDLADEFVDHFPRSQSAGIKNSPEVALDFAGRNANLHERAEHLRHIPGGTNGINRIYTDPVTDQALQAAAHLSVDDQIKLAHQTLQQRFPNIDPGKLEQFASNMVHNPDVRTQGLFGNDPIYDLHRYLTQHNNRLHGAATISDAIGEGMHNGAHGVNVEEFLAANKIHPDIGAHHIAQRTGRNPADILKANIPEELANELVSFTPTYKIPPAAANTQGILKNLSTIWKAGALAAPASRVRDFAGGVVQNALMGHTGGWNDARNIAHGVPLKGDYSHLSDVKDLMARHNLTHDEAVKAILSVEAPRSHGMLADIPQGQVGAKIEDLLAQIPGNEQSGFRKVMARAGKSLIRGELDRAGNPISKGIPIDPSNIAGAFGRESTGYGPAAASNVVSGASDEFNRHAGILGQMSHGVNPEVAGKATRAAQVDYDPATFTPTERAIKNLIPFYSFNSRMGVHTGKQITDPGGRLSQLLKAEDRAHSGDKTLPDSLLAGTAIPLGERPDGTKRFINGLGLMSETPSRLIGSAIGGDLKGTAYDTLAMLNPMLKVPLEATTGQSFFQRGAMQNELTPNVGQILADLQTHAGLREKDAGPVRFPGSNALEQALQISPISRPISTVRGLTDVRKGIPEKLINSLTGLKIKDISPQSQAYTLSKRASDLAKSEGGKVREDVYFSKRELSTLEKTNPKMAARQKELQQLLKDLQAKQSSGKKSTSGQHFVK